MSWPLPCFNINSDAGKAWLEEYLGPDSKLTEIGEDIKINASVVVFEDKVYLTYGNTESGGPVLKSFNGNN